MASRFRSAYGKMLAAIQNQPRCGSISIYRKLVGRILSLRRLGLSTTARSAAMQSSVVSLRTGGETCPAAAHAPLKSCFVRGGNLVTRISRHGFSAPWTLFVSCISGHGNVVRFSNATSTCLLGRIAIGDWLTALVGIVSLAVLFRWKVSNPLLIAATAVVGLIAFPLLSPTWVMVK